MGIVPPLADFTYKNNSIVCTTERRTRKIKIVWQKKQQKIQQKQQKSWKKLCVP